MFPDVGGSGCDMCFTFVYMGPGGAVTVIFFFFAGASVLAFASVSVLFLLDTCARPFVRGFRCAETLMSGLFVLVSCTEFRTVLECFKACCCLRLVLRCDEPLGLVVLYSCCSLLFSSHLTYKVCQTRSPVASQLRSFKGARNACNRDRYHMRGL